MFVTFELGSRGCIHKLLVQIITEKSGAEFWAQDGFHHKHTSSVPIKQSASICIVSLTLFQKKGLQISTDLKGRRGDSPKMLPEEFTLILSPVSCATRQEINSYVS